MRIIPALFLSVIAISYGMVTRVRNADYRDAVDLWSKTVIQSPGSWVARGNLARALDAVGRRDEAMIQYAATIPLHPNELSEIEMDFGVDLAKAGRLHEALPHLDEAIRLQKVAAEHDPNADKNGLARSIVLIQQVHDRFAAIEAQNAERGIRR